MTTAPHISWTQIQMYLRCSMQYYFRYVQGLKERPRLNMSNGKAGHEALEVNRIHKIAESEDQSIEEILDTFSTSFDRELAEFEKRDFGPDDDPGRTKDGTVQGLTIYRAKEAPLVTPIAVELEFLVPVEQTEEFHEETLPINGKIDVIQKKVTTTRNYPVPIERTQIVDDKFVGRLPSNLQDLADMNDQLTVYDYATFKAGKPVDQLAFEHFIPPTKTIPSRIIQTTRSEAFMTPVEREKRHQRLLFKARQVMRAIKDGVFIPVDNPQTCNQCGYKTICQYSLAEKDYNRLQSNRGQSWQPAPVPASLSQSPSKTSNNSSKKEPPPSLKSRPKPPSPLRSSTKSGTSRSSSKKSRGKPVSPSVPSSPSHRSA